MFPRATQIGQFLSFFGGRSSIDRVDPIEQFLSDETIATVIAGEVEELSEGEDRVQVGEVSELVCAGGGREGGISL
jgi:hypothetical protein